MSIVAVMYMSVGVRVLCPSMPWYGMLDTELVGSDMLK